MLSATAKHFFSFIFFFANKGRMEDKLKMYKTIEMYSKELTDAGLVVDQGMIFLDVATLEYAKKSKKPVPTIKLQVGYHDNLSADKIKQILESGNSDNLDADEIIRHLSNGIPDNLQFRLRRQELSIPVSENLFDMNMQVVYKLARKDATLSVAVSSSLLKSWGLPDWKALKSRVSVKQEWQIISMKDVLAQYAKDCPITLDDAQLYVVTNNSNMDGAAVLLDNDYLNDIHKRFGDYWILPSSIHEILVLPMQAYEKSNGKAYEEARNSLLNMIKEVNDTQVIFQEVLSYSLMKYTSDGLELA